MGILRWDPFKDVSSAQERLQRFIDEPSFAAPALGAPNRGCYMPVVDILESKGYVVVRAELPGVNREDITIEIEGDVLLLRGERKFEKEVEHENYHRMECSYGTFQRAFTLPELIRKEEVTAQFEQGVLEIRMPKGSEKKEIPVSGE